jgi:hypothetical protein
MAVPLKLPFESTGSVIFQFDKSKLPLGATEEFKAMMSAPKSSELLLWSF